MLYDSFLNQMCNGHRLARAWFLQIDLVCEACVYVSVCLPPGLVITSGMMWHDMDFI